MRNVLKDPLLIAGNIIVYFMLGVMGIAGIALLGAGVALPFFSGSIAEEMRVELADPSFVFPFWSALAVLALALAIVVLFFLFFDKLRRIIRTVGEGDPFVPQNARRLSLMAWYMLAVQLVALPLTAIGVYLAGIFSELDEVSLTVDGGWGFDGSSILLIITLFILARVFRQGARMREDLEGTV
ncbi:DUF2975 domain-containing protein [Qipengyuania sp. JC766]|uniref:DUF2975 domain-containing protein n=1 Tax=Qipengyuania sp. JC766 TaxID=3232139 RepID=UPI003459BF0A